MTCHGEFVRGCCKRPPTFPRVILMMGGAAAVMVARVILTALARAAAHRLDHAQGVATKLSVDHLP